MINDQGKPEDRFASMRSEIAVLLTERGVTATDSLTAALDDQELEGVLATIYYYDDEKKDKGAGLLVYMIRSGEHVGYRRPEERGQAPYGTISPTLRKAIRGSCLSPNGFTREMARDMLRGKAGKLGMPVDSLIDAVMGADWTETKPDARHDPEAPREERIKDQLRYEQERAKAEGLGV